MRGIIKDILEILLTLLAIVRTAQEVKNARDKKQQELLEKQKQLELPLRQPDNSKKRNKKA